MTGPAPTLAGLDETTVVRLDHVQLYYTYMGTPLTLTEAEAGWLVLTSDGMRQLLRRSPARTRRRGHVHRWIA